MRIRGFLFALAGTAALVATAALAIARPEPTPFVTLDSGWVGKYGWGVWAERSTGREGAGRHGAQRPFLTAGVIQRSFGHTYTERDNGLGTGLPGHLTAKRPPLIVVNEAYGEVKTKMTVVGMAFAPAARRLRLTRPDNSHQTIWLRRLNPRQARKTRLERFRFTAFAVRGAWCTKQMVSYNAKGARLWESEEGQCASREEDGRPGLSTHRHAPGTTG